jgi:hypothetical protein
MKHILSLLLLVSCQTNAPLPTSLSAVPESAPGASLSPTSKSLAPARPPSQTISEDLNGDGVADPVTLTETTLIAGEVTFQVGAKGKQREGSRHIQLIDIDTKDNAKEVLVAGECEAMPTADAMYDPCGYYLFSYREKTLKQISNPLGGDDFSGFYEMFHSPEGNGRLSYYREDCGKSHTVVFRLQKGALVVEKNQQGVAKNTDCR